MALFRCGGGSGGGLPVDFAGPPDYQDGVATLSNGSDRTISVSQMPKYIIFCLVAQYSNYEFCFAIIDVANDKAYRYSYYNTAIHNEDWTSAYKNYVTSITSSQITIHNNWGRNIRLDVGVFY